MIIKRGVLLAGIAIGAFLIDFAYHLDPALGMPHYHPSLLAVVLSAVGGMMVLAVWGYCFSWAIRTSSCLWIGADLLLGIFAVTLQALVGPVEKPKREAGVTEVAISDRDRR